jgi:hypothetical protein
MEWNRAAACTVVGVNRRRSYNRQLNETKEPVNMSLPSSFDRRAIRVALALSLVALALVASYALAAASSPKVLPVEPNGGIGGEIVLPVEPDGGIGGEVVFPVEPDGGIGN